MPLEAVQPQEQTPMAKGCNTNTTVNSISTNLNRRRQFILGLINIMSEQPSTHHITTGATKGSSKFDPFDFTFLSSAPEETISLLARLCSKVGLVPPLLMIPAELRLRIYEFAFEAHWEQGEMRICQGEYLMQHNQVKGIQGMEIKDDFKPRILEPPLLRTCKLFREEGNAEYKLFLQAICNSLSREAQAWAHSQCSTRTKLGLFLHLLYFNGKYEISIKAALGNGAAHKAENAETELERLYRIEIREMIKVLSELEFTFKAG